MQALGLILPTVCSWPYSPGKDSLPSGAILHSVCHEAKGRLLRLRRGLPTQAL